MPLPEYLMVVDLDVDPSVSKEWNKWYDEVHLEEITSCPGFVRATRYIAPEQEDGRERQLTIYEITRPDVRSTPELAAARGVGPFEDDVNYRSRVYRRHLVYEGSDE